MISFIKATKNDIPKIQELANRSWNSAYRNILSQEQIDYMLTTFLSVQSIKEQINTGYEYFIIKGDKPVGFAAIKDESDKVFLSKIYILSSFVFIRFKEIFWLISVI